MDTIHEAQPAASSSSSSLRPYSPSVSSSLIDGQEHDQDQEDGASRSTPTLNTAASSLYIDRSSRPRVKRSTRGFSTTCATVDNPEGLADQHGSSSVPIYQTATFKGGPGQPFDYSRSGNPTRSYLQHHIAKIADAKHAFVVSSGMGALDVIFRGLKPGDEIIAGNDLYGGSNRLLTFLKTSGGFAVHHLDTTRPEVLLPVLSRPGSKVKYVLLESPTNPLLQIVDIETIATLVHRHVPEAVVIVDNTMMSPFLQKPLELGADIVYDSATKYLSGHHDLMAGAIYCNRDDLAQQMAFVINSIGNGLSPMDSFLLLRGIKTMAIRMERQQATACLVAAYLDNLGFKVNFPSLANHPGKTIHDRLAKGPGAVLSFETGDVALSEKIVGATRLWGISVSFGAVNSLISMPCLMSHASISPAVRKERNLPEHLIRLCVGIEDPDDLLDDLESALMQAGAIRIVDDPELQGELKVERVPLASEQDQEEEGSAIAAAALAASTLAGAPQAQIGDFVTSAPGKVILFGEHAVVHGVTAIAGALDLRCYCHVETRSDNKISLILPDIGLEKTWDLDALPFDDLLAQQHTQNENVEPDTLPNATTSPDLGFLAKLAQDDKLAGVGAIGQDGKEDGMNGKAGLSLQSFLYLYMRLTKPSQRHARTFTIRSALPIGAGLGSSAAFSVCIASALLYLNNHLPFPTSAKPSPDAAHTINSWALVGERILHGNPSGVDNSVATLGGALVFRKSKFVGEAPSMKSVQGFRSIRFLLTDTKVPRDTKTLVANVAKLREQDPDYVAGLFQEVQHIAENATATLSSTHLSRSELIHRLEELVDRNHNILVQLGVSHPALEAVKVKAAQQPYNLHTKLTGAGGGGCAVTIVPDDFPEPLLQQLKEELYADGFACYETAVGGAGFGAISLDSKPSSDNTTIVSSEGGAERDIRPVRSQFEAAPTSALEGWASQIGRWSLA